MLSNLTKKFLLAALLLPAMVLAQDTDTLLTELQRDWAVANYNLQGDAQLDAYEKLVERAESAVNQHPKSAELLIWNGIIKSSYAGAKGGLGALSLAKGARAALEAALKVDDRALAGSAYTSLGTLYYKVPGWPVGFGSDKKAVQLLQKAIEINPDGIDSNYFYGDFLLNQKEYEQAETYLLRASNAAPRPNRPVADAGRQAEIDAALSLTRKKLGRTGS